MTSETELANKIYIASKQMSKAFYAKNQHDFTKAEREYYELTKGMSKRRVYKLLDKADIALSGL